jgi:hypothetical protein
MSALLQQARANSPNLAILGGADSDRTTLALVPDNTPDNTLTRVAVRVAAKDEGLGVRAVEVEETDLLLVATLGSALGDSANSQ